MNPFQYDWPGGSFRYSCGDSLFVQARRALIRSRLRTGHNLHNLSMLEDVSGLDPALNLFYVKL